jgi:hypothetical protein
MDEATRTSSLQESLEDTVKKLELEERPILRQSKLLLESRATNRCILSQNAANLAAVMNRISPHQLEEFNTYPLAHQLGFLHIIPERDFDINSATILDVNFLGLFPKCILQKLYHYARQVEAANDDNEYFMKCVNDLITAYIYRPIVIQKIIHILLAKKKKDLKDAHTTQSLASQRNDESTNYASRYSNQTHRPYATTETQIITDPNQNLCHTTKCQLLRAKGILRRPMVCLKGKNMCSGCVNESQRHKKTQQMELEILSNSSSNNVWSPFLQWTRSPTTLRNLRLALSHLTNFRQTKRNDHIYGASRYIANTLGIILVEHNVSDLIDQPMSHTERKQAWRIATFWCKCPSTLREIHNFGVRNFCRRCNYLCKNDHNNDNVCPFCSCNESWKIQGNPCLACQFASLIYQNPFQFRLQQYLARWLNPEDSDDTDAANSTTSIPH